MIRAAIYARYSSDRQSERSIEDQLRLCHELAERQGWHVQGVYTDYAISGANLNRPGLNSIMDAVASGAVDIVVAEALDRISRDQEHAAGIRKRLAFAGVAIHTIAEGEVSKLHVAFKSAMAEMFLDDLRQKTKRGQRGRVEAGAMVASPGYGYAPDRTPGPDGLPMPGQWKINAAEAAIVRRIFGEYAAGASPRAIAARLNAEHIPAPRGGEWNASTINGNAARGNGILHNRLYLGEVAWNRQSFVKDPDTGKRRARLNPRSEWIVKQVPELRIVDDEAWELAQGRKGSFTGMRVDHKRRPKRLLSGLVVCGCCGSAFTMSGADRLRCVGHVERGTCDNNRTVKMTELEARVLDGLKGKLIAPDVVEAFIAEYEAEAKRRRLELVGRRAGLESELSQIEKQIGNLVAALAAGATSPAIIDQLNELEGRKARIAEELGADAIPNVIDFRPSLADRYRRMLDRLQNALNDGRANIRETSIGVIRSMVTKVAIYPGPKRGAVEIELEGDLAIIMQIARLADQTGDLGSMVMVVAGAGFEPATFRL